MARHKKTDKAPKAPKTIGTTRSLSAFVKSIRDVMLRSNCASALQYVPELTRMHYWGDIDTHGFAILDELRGYFPQVTSFLMDRETLFAHRLHWGDEVAPARHDLPRLSSVEADLYDDIRLDRIQPNLRLEQERVGQNWVTRGVVGAFHKTQGSGHTQVTTSGDSHSKSSPLR